MIKEPKLPHKLKWGDRTAARVDEVGYLIGIRLVGYTVDEVEYSIGIRLAGYAAQKEEIIAEVHESVADEVGAWQLPEDFDPWGSDVFMKEPRAGAYYKYIKIKNIVHEES